MARRIILKQGGLNDKSTPSGYKSIGLDNNTLSEQSGVLNTPIGGPSYKIYSAVFSQTASNAPVATILENTIGDIVWTYESTGIYYGNLVNGFTGTLPTQQIITGLEQTDQLYFVFVTKIDNDKISIRTNRSAAGNFGDAVSLAALQDDILNGNTSTGTFIEIKLYL